jgi:hypothetical protein
VGIAARDGVAVAIEVHHGHLVGYPPMRDGRAKGAKGQGAKSGLFLLPILPSFLPLPLTPLQYRTPCRGLLCSVPPLNAPGGPG